MGSIGTLRALFDAAHGQANWSQTGFSSRQMHSNFAGLTQLLTQMNCTCAQHSAVRLTNALGEVDVLVIPPPTGTYSAAKECWRLLRTSLFSSDEILEVIRFIYRGGRLLAF